MRAIKLLFKFHLADKNVCVTGDILVHLLGTMGPKKNVSGPANIVLFIRFMYFVLFIATLMT